MCPQILLAPIEEIRVFTAYLSHIRVVCRLETWLTRSNETRWLALDLHIKCPENRRELSIALNEKSHVFMADIHPNCAERRLKIWLQWAEEIHVLALEQVICLGNGLETSLASYEVISVYYILFVQSMCSKYDVRQLNETELYMVSNMTRARRRH